MPLVSVTRLRIRRWWYLPEFFVRSMRIGRQAAAAPGNLAVALLRDRNRAFWTATLWSDERSMRAFMLESPHGDAMPKLLDWCDEASLVHWKQDVVELPSWDVAHKRLLQNGRKSKLNRPSASHNAHQIPAPTLSRTGQVRIK